jgi:hypothetical protein
MTETKSGLVQLPDADTIARVVLHGDLKQLTAQQKLSYYRAVCESVGLNPLTQPFQYLVLSGKEVLYAKRDATDQLRKLHNVSVKISAREVLDDCYVVTAQATMPSGRSDESIGAVPIAGLKGDAKANALMKAETKSKRRVTLAICGLGMLDETELETIEELKPVVSGTTPAADESGQHVFMPEGLDPSDLPDGVVYLKKWAVGMGKAKGFIWHTGQGPTDDGLALYKQVEQARQWCQEGTPVTVKTKKSQTSDHIYVDTIEPFKTARPAASSLLANNEDPF